MNRILFLVVLVSLLVSAPLAIKYAIDAKRTQQDLATQIEAATVARDNLTRVFDSLEAKTGQVTALTGQLDSVGDLLRSSSLRVNELRTRESRMTRTIDSLNDLLSQQLATLSGQRAEIASARSLLADTSRVLSDTRDLLTIALQQAEERDLLLVRLQPWYMKWKHDATERNWLEKIFGADKAKSPGFPEPAFPVISTTPADSVTQDTSAAMQASM